MKFCSEINWYTTYHPHLVLPFSSYRVIGRMGTYNPTSIFPWNQRRSLFLPPKSCCKLSWASGNIWKRSRELSDYWTIRCILKQEPQAAMTMQLNWLRRMLCWPEGIVKVSCQLLDGQAIKMPGFGSGVRSCCPWLFWNLFLWRFSTKNWLMWWIFVPLHKSWMYKPF